MTMETLSLEGTRPKIRNFLSPLSVWARGARELEDSSFHLALGVDVMISSKTASSVDYKGTSKDDDVANQKEEIRQP